MSIKYFCNKTNILYETDCNLTPNTDVNELYKSLKFTQSNPHKLMFVTLAYLLNDVNFSDQITSSIKIPKEFRNLILCFISKKEKLNIYL